MIQQACGQVWRTDTGESNKGKKRAWSIEELREKLGVAAPKTEVKPARSAPTHETPAQRPRIVRRGMERRALEPAYG